MPRFVQYGKYTPEALAAIIEGGYAEREKVVRAAAESVGGTPECIYQVDGSDWDIMGILELPSSDVAFSVLRMSQATGAFSRVAMHQVRTGAEADSARVSMDWTAPGSS